MGRTHYDQQLRPSKHTKSSTGCWTCRSRRVKCDEHKPACRQCQKRHLSCQGYGLRLHWLAPETGPIACEARDTPRESIQRRQLPIYRAASALGHDEVEQILRSLDEVQNADFGGTPSSCTFMVHSFGVFEKSSNSTKEATQVSLEPAPPNPYRNQMGQSHHYYEGNGGSVSDTTFSIHHETSQCNKDNGHRYSDDHQTPVHVTSNHHSPEKHIVNPVFGQIFGDSCSDSSLSLQVAPITTSDEDLPSPWNHSRHHWSFIDNFEDPLWLAQRKETSPRPALDSLQLPSCERYLMRYYIEKVVQLSCVIDNAKSPWKTIHLPRALQGIGEISIGRPTSTIRSALRKDLLSISAFQLSNDHRFHSRQDEADKWSCAAAKYRCEAIALLNQAVKQDLSPHLRPKYKDFLATMISMISINVMSGDTSTCAVHLDGAAQLISHMKSYKSEYSSKARALHRIYFYVRLIFESTAPISLTPELQLRRALHLKSMDTSENSHFIALHRNKGSSSSALDMSSYECVYGIPQYLLDLMRRTIENVDKVIGPRVEDDMACDGIVRECDSLEDELLGWDSEGILSAAGSQNTNAQIIGHQTRAFHNALIIYFSQHIRNLHHRYLNSYIAAVIDSVEEIEQIKANMGILAAPLYWPAFIAASEAFDKNLQERFRRWYDRVEVYGIEAVRTGVRVIFEVWENGAAANRPTCAWREVVKRTGAVLMLT